jgi:hypothetical protein
VVLVAHHVDARFGPVTVDLALTRPQPTLTVTTAGQGSGVVSLDPPGPTFRFAEDVTLAAGPAIGSTFAGWSGAITGDANPVVLNELFESATITATFDKGGYAAAVPVILGAPGE